MIYLRLFWEFFKVGLFSVGGGLATVPFLQSISSKTGWYTIEQLTDMIAISESTPGPIGANMATFAGYSTAGILGGLVAVLGLVMPSVIIIIIIAKILEKFRASSVVNDIFSFIRPASVALIAAAGIEIISISLFSFDLFSPSNFWAIFNLKSILLAVVLCVLTNKFKLHPIFYIIGSAIVGILFRFAE